MTTTIDLNDIDVTAEDTPAVATADPATVKQVNFIASLAEKKALDAESIEIVRDATELIAADRLSKADASTIIDHLIALPWKPRENTAPTAEPGTFHMLDGEVYRVRESKAGRAYAERMAVTPGHCRGHYDFTDPSGFDAPRTWHGEYDDACDSRTADKVEWSYAKGVIFRLTAETKLTATQAAEIGHRTARCVYCGRELTHPASLTAGYGAICAERQGLPWGM